MTRRPASTSRLTLQRFADGVLRAHRDWVVTEEPLEIRVLHHTPARVETVSVSVTMRTPGHDFELAAGFLCGEGIVGDARDVDSIAYCVEEVQRYNVVNVRLRRGVAFDPRRLQRHFYTTSSCGVCGKTSLEALEVAGCRALPPGPLLTAATVRALPARLRAAQPLFARTGGLHAAGLFAPDGALHCLREDVGRHNAVDKVVGHVLMNGGPPAGGGVLVLSGRAGFELVQKAVVARLPVVAAVGAPSSLAVKLARAFDLTLLGFVGEERFNVYSGAHRLAG